MINLIFGLLIGIFLGAYIANKNFRAKVTKEIKALSSKNSKKTEKKKDKYLQ